MPQTTNSITPNKLSVPDLISVGVFTALYFVLVTVATFTCALLPGVGNKLANVEIDENAMKKPEAIIRSMTPRERRNPGILNASRRKRIAAGSGTTVQDVNALIRQFEQAKGMMKQMMNARGKRGRMRLPF